MLQVGGPDIPQHNHIMNRNLDRNGILWNPGREVLEEATTVNGIQHRQPAFASSTALVARARTAAMISETCAGHSFSRKVFYPWKPCSYLYESVSGTNTGREASSQTLSAKQNVLEIQTSQTRTNIDATSILNNVTKHPQFFFK